MLSSLNSFNLSFLLFCSLSFSLSLCLYYYYYYYYTVDSITLCVIFVINWHNVI